jgi:hypothetical protein
MSMPALNIRRTRRGGSNPPPPIPLVDAVAADEVIDMMGISCVESNLTNADAVTAFNYLNFIHARVGRIDPNGSNRSLISALATCTRPVDWGGAVDDRGSFTPADRIDEMTTHVAGGLSHMAGPNEPNGNASSGATWPMTIASNGPTSSDQYLGRAEVKRQHDLIASTRVTKGVTAIPYLMAPMAAKNKLDWWSALLAAGSVSADIQNIHLYMGGQDILKGGDLLANMNACNTALPGATDLWLTEFGYHDFLATVETHIPTSQAAQAVYFPRGILQLANLKKSTKLKKAFIYELLDDPGASSPDYEAHFGLFKMVTGTITPKASATAIHNLMALYNDPGVTYTPVGLDYQLNNLNAINNIETTLHQKRNGHWLLGIWRNESVYNTSSHATISVPDVNIQVLLPPSRTSTANRPTAGTSIGMGSGTITIPLGPDVTVLEIV